MKQENENIIMSTTDYNNMIIGFLTVVLIVVGLCYVLFSDSPAPTQISDKCGCK